MRIFSSCLGLIFSGALAVASPLSSQEVAAADLKLENSHKAILIDGSGVYHREISSQESLAQQFFDQGLRYAWGFYFPESIASYQQAAIHDSEHPMIYWGLAHAMGPNPNSRYGGMPDDPKGEGLKAINKALSLIDNASALEREMINALHILYDQDSIADDHQRDLAYMRAAGALQKKYPNDPDIASLYAASFMNIGRWNYWNHDGSPVGDTGKIAAVLESALASHPDHPGANHLYIHLMEASREPERALAAADRLAATMPMAGHIVHMPSHIYVRVGQFEKAVASNVRSQEVDKEFLQIWGDRPLPDLGTYPLSAKIHAPHAIDFIKYAASFQGNYAVAIDAAKKLIADINPDNQKNGRNQKRLSGVCLVNKMFGHWDEILDSQPTASGTPYLDGIWSYCLGGAYTAKGDLISARRELGKIWQIASLKNVDQYRVGPTPVSSLLKLAALGLSGEIKQASGALSEAIADYQAAVELEDKNGYIEPPDWPQPMRHYLGAALLKAGRAAEAETVYRQDLEWHQNNGWALFGLWQSLAAQGKALEAEETFEAYKYAWRDADTKLSGSRF
ncbi:MAG: tetratricopeptide repeat protein [Porticoccaceae bacterium]